jgi:hypothetical protein
MPIPEGWTDDLNIQIAPGHTLDELVDFILQAVVRRDDSSTIIAELVRNFGVSEDDAVLALDRACGGVFRAATGDPENCPDQQKDPVAWLGYQRCLREPSLFSAIFPQSSSTRRITQDGLQDERKDGWRKILLWLSGFVFALLFALWILLALRN